MYVNKKRLILLASPSLLLLQWLIVLKILIRGKDTDCQLHAYLYMFIVTFELIISLCTRCTQTLSSLLGI